MRTEAQRASAARRLHRRAAQQRRAARRPTERDLSFRAQWKAARTRTKLFSDITTERARRVGPGRHYASCEINARGVMYEMIGPDPERWAAAMCAERKRSTIDHQLYQLRNGIVRRPPIRRRSAHSLPILQLC